MPNIFKAFSRTKAEPYKFPNAAEIVVPGTEPEPEPEPEPAPGSDEEFFPLGDGPSPEREEAGFDVLVSDDEQEDEAGLETETKETPISFAQIQAEQILADARRDADKILMQAREKADEEAKEVFAKARGEGYQEGYVAGMAQSAEESRRLR